MKISFLGGTGTVTGSRYLLETERGRVLVDCGLFQGLKELRLRNWAPFPVSPQSVHAMLLTHAHIDHSGFIPALVRDGFRGRIHASRATQALARILLLDCGYLQEEEARYANKRGYSKHAPALPLYTVADAERALVHFQPHENGEEFSPLEGFTAQFRKAGHILGSRTALVRANSISLLFSGDLGRPKDLIMPPPEPPPRADFVLVESTYGNRPHPETDPEEQLGAIVQRTVARSGVVLIPAFSVGRTQLVLLYLYRLKKAGKIPDVPVFLNSPMSINVTDLVSRFPEEHHLSPEECRGLCEVAKEVQSVDESRRLNERKGPMIILSANGMVSGGRILHHIRQFGPDPRTSIVLTGYQAAGTRGRTLQQGAATLRMFGEDVPIRAEVELLEGLSAHADAAEIVSWLKKIPRPPKAVFVTHGEPDAALALKTQIEAELGFRCEIPSYLETIELGSFA